MHSFLVVLSSILIGIAYVVFAIAILKGKAKPHRTTRFVLLVVEALSFAALLAQGSTTAVWIPGVFTLFSLLLFILSIKNGMGGWTRTDIICLCIAILGILIWRATNDPLTGLLFSMLADFSGIVPILIKTFKYPETEVWTFYGIGSVGVILNMLAIDERTFSEFIFPLYILLINIIMIVLIFRKKIVFTRKK